MVMKVYKNANLNKKHYSSVIAIGNFDGLHLGHQKVIREAKQKAKKNNLPFGVMTFEPVPVMFFNKYNKDHRINSLQQKKKHFRYPWISIYTYAYLHMRICKWLPLPR